MLEKRNFTLSELEVRAAVDGQEGQHATGYAAVFAADSCDLGGFVERIAPGAFQRSLQESAAGQRNIFALWSHLDDQPLGSTSGGKLVLSEDDRGLVFDLDVSRMTLAQIDALRDGELRMSFGFSVREQEWREDDTGRVERTLIDVDLVEISFVISPAYPDTSAALRSLASWREETVIEVKPTENRSNLIKKVLLYKVNARIR